MTQENQKALNKIIKESIKKLNKMARELKDQNGDYDYGDALNIDWELYDDCYKIRHLLEEIKGE